jgi:hypothetical protein
MEWCLVFVNVVVNKTIKLNEQIYLTINKSQKYWKYSGDKYKQKILTLEHAQKCNNV